MYGDQHTQQSHLALADLSREQRVRCRLVQTASAAKRKQVTVGKMRLR